jgi:hypothetical protein
MIASDILAMLRSRYAPPTWTFFGEVFASVGGGGTRADGIAVAMWRSRGLEIHGFEVKVSRADWLRELKKPDKAEEIFSYCDRWFLVTSDDSIVKDAELPPKWGWLVPRGSNLCVKAKAGELQSVPLTKWFLCSIIRMAHREIEKARAEDPEGKISAAYKVGRARGEEASRYERRSATDKLERQSKMISDFEQASGLRLSSWSAGKIGEAVRFVVDGGLEGQRSALQELKIRAEQIAAEVGRPLAVEARTEENLIARGI